MRFGVHLPLIGWDGDRFTLERLTRVASAAHRLGFEMICANDHLVYRRPWLDGLVALSAVLHVAPDAQLMTSVALPLSRGHVSLAKALAAIDLLSGGRLIAGLGAGAARPDFDAAGIPFDERWKRFDEVVPAMRSLWARDGTPFQGTYYDTTGLRLEPYPAVPEGPPIWIGTWGSEAGLRRIATYGDGWIASAFNTTPESFRHGKAILTELLGESGRGVSEVPNALVTMWLYVTEEDGVRRDVIDRLARMVERDPAVIEATLPIGPASFCEEIVARYQESGVERIAFWPVKEEVSQLEAIASRLMPTRQG
jgi:alkanesulfonate monooxygenase SsuD/methylene tetrahydromethanopterin reductase-like flavin-dependent oxidoreductase (luciferase family)